LFHKNRIITDCCSAQAVCKQIDCTELKNGIGTSILFFLRPIEFRFATVTVTVGKIDWHRGLRIQKCQKQIKVFFSDGSTEKTKSNEVSWISYALSLGVSLRF
jgi:heterodisulfide reductase subunit A-like polyferredoxin